MSAPSVSDDQFGVNPQNPWLGLSSFTEELCGYFYGREDETAELFRLLKRETLTVLFGQSGLGKTSMLQAGLFPHLRQADFLPIQIRLLYGEDAPELAYQVKAALEQRIEAGEVDAPKPDTSETLWEYFHRQDVCFWNAKQRLMTPVLVFDQFEEIFTLGQSDLARRRQSQTFLAELADLIENRPPTALKDELDRGHGRGERFVFDQESCKVILSLREDYLPDLEGLRPQIRSIMQNRMRIVRMNGQQAYQAVKKPGGALLEEGVAEQIVKFVSGAKELDSLDSSSSADALAGLQVEPALLSVVCRELNAKRQKLQLPRITPHLLAGNSSEIIAEFYERSMADLPRDARVFVEDRLLTKSGYRDNVDLETAVSYGVSRETIDKLVDRRLLRLEDRFGGQRVELTHDVLTEVIRTSRDSRQRQEAAEAEELARKKRLRKILKAVSVGVAILTLTLLLGGYFFGEWRRQQGNWTREFNVDFSQAPSNRKEQPDWLKERFDFKNCDATDSVLPWSVVNGAMEMKQQEWCWLKNVGIRNDTKVVVDLRFTGLPEAFQICINAKDKLRQRENNPPGYSCRFAIWESSMDLITRNEIDRPCEFNSLLINAMPQTRSGGMKNFQLTFRREGETVSLEVEGTDVTDVHRETYLIPLVGEHGSQFEKIGIRTWGKEGSVEVLSISAFRFKLPEKTSPIVAGDALVEAGYLEEAIMKYKAIATDYQKISNSISALAFAKGYLLADHLKDADSRNWCYQGLNNLKEHLQSHWLATWFHPFQSAECAKYLDQVREVETLLQWKKGEYQEALKQFDSIFKANPDTRIVVECLQAEHKLLTPEFSGKLLQGVGKTTKLAGLDISSFGMTDLDALADVPSLRGLDCRRNNVSSIAPLRNMKQLRALYCGQNSIVDLEPIKSLPLIVLDCAQNQIESLEPISGMELNYFYCGGNRIKDLSPLKVKSLYFLDCSANQISSLDQVSGSLNLGELYCGSNQIRSLEPLRQAKALRYLDCNSNAIQTLEPLKDLNLDSLDCSKNPIATLEPFVERKPPKLFVFDDCEKLPEAEIKRAINVWQSEGLQSNVSYAKFALARKRGDVLAELAQKGNGGHGYLFVQKNLAASEAEQFCKKLRGHLVTIANEEENKFLKEIATPEVSYRIGMTFSDGEPHWVTGEAVDKKFVSTLTDFRPTDEVVTWTDGLWLPLQEDRPMPFIVEWDP